MTDDEGDGREAYKEQFGARLEDLVNGYTPHMQLCEVVGILHVQAHLLIHAMVEAEEDDDEDEGGDDENI